MGRLRPFGVYLLQKREERFISRTRGFRWLCFDKLLPSFQFVFLEFSEISPSPPCWIVDYNTKVKWHFAFPDSRCCINIRKEAMKPPWLRAHISIHCFAHEDVTWKLRFHTCGFECLIRSRDGCENIPHAPRQMLELWPQAGDAWTAASHFHGPRGIHLNSMALQKPGSRETEM